MENSSSNHRILNNIIKLMLVTILILLTLKNVNAQPVTSLPKGNSLLVTVDSIYTHGLTMRGLTADFPFPVITRITIIDSSFKHVPGLAHSSQWIGSNELAENGQLVSDIWKPLVEYHRDNPAYPAEPDIYKYTPLPLFTEVRDDTLLPISTMLVMDASWSMYENKEIKDAVAAGKLFINLLQPGDRTGVIAFDDSIFVNYGITDIKDTLYNAIDKAGKDPSPGKTALFDALMTALDSISLEDPNRRRNIIVYADGEDNASDTSKNNLSTIIAKAKANDVQIHTIALGALVIDVEKLRRIAFETNGYFFKVTTAQEMMPIYEQLANLFHSYYLMAHTSTDSILNNTWREVFVTVNNGDFGGAGKGTYFVPGQPDFSLDLVSNVKRSYKVGNDIEYFVMPGDTFDYNIKVTNLGPGESNSVELVHYLPDSVHFLHATMQPLPGNSDSLFWKLPGMQPGEEITVTVTVRLGTHVSEQTAYLLSNAIMTDALSNVYLDSDTVRVRFNDPSLRSDIAGHLSAITDSVSIAGNDTLRYVRKGESYSYVIAVTNKSSIVAEDVAVVDKLPQFVNFENSIPTPYFISDDSITWNLGNVASNSSTEIMLTVRVSDQMPDQQSYIINTIKVNASNEDSTLLANNVTSDTIYHYVPPVIPCDVAVHQVASTDSMAIFENDTTQYVRKGENYSYKITITNESSVAAENVNIVDMLPLFVDYENAAPTPTMISEDSVVWQVGNLAPRASADIMLNVRASNQLPDDHEEIINTVRITAENEDANLLANNIHHNTLYNSALYCPDTPPILEVTPDVVDLGARLSFRIKVFAPIQSWDIWVYFANGNIDSTFADDLITYTSLNENEFVEFEWNLTNSFGYIQQETEEIIFELRTVDACEHAKTAQATITTQNTDDFIFVRNVFLPNNEDFFPIRFKLSSYRDAQLDLYDISGTHIAKLTNAPYPAGWNTYEWNGFTESGKKVGSGVYIVTIRSGELKSWKKLIVVL